LRWRCRSINRMAFVDWKTIAADRWIVAVDFDQLLGAGMAARLVVGR
jgi:hypothetical protein